MDCWMAFSFDVTFLSQKNKDYFINSEFCYFKYLCSYLLGSLWERINFSYSIDVISTCCFIEILQIVIQENLFLKASWRLIIYPILRWMLCQWKNVHQDIIMTFSRSRKAQGRKVNMFFLMRLLFLKFWD